MNYKKEFKILKLITHTLLFITIRFFPTINR